MLLVVGTCADRPIKSGHTLLARMRSSKPFVWLALYEHAQLCTASKGSFVDVEQGGWDVQPTQGGAILHCRTVFHSAHTQSADENPI